MKLNREILIIGIIGLFSIATFLLSGNFLHIFLIWNMFLAIIPFWILKIEKKTNKNILKILTILAWILFLPNAFYTVTDLIHIQNLEFYFFENPYASATYVEDITNWMEIVNLFLVSTFGFFSGLKNVDKFIKRFKNTWQKTVIIAVLSVLSGIAIYIGRFLRFNSWDVLNPVVLVKSVIEDLNGFYIKYIILFSLFIFVSCMVFSMTKSNSEKE